MISVLFHGAVALKDAQWWSALTDVTSSSGYAYGLHDDRQHSMDSVRVGVFANVGVPEWVLSSGYSFLALYHTYDADIDTFNVHAAVSVDLLRWKWVTMVASNADMPYFHVDAESGRVLLMHEQWMDPNSTSPSRLRASVFSNVSSLLSGQAPAVTSLKPTSLSGLEGTPNV